MLAGPLALVLCASAASRPPTTGEPCWVEVTKESLKGTQASRIVGFVVGTDAEMISVVSNTQERHILRKDIVSFGHPEKDEVDEGDRDYLPILQERWENTLAERRAPAIESAYDRFKDQTRIEFRFTRMSACNLAVAAAVLSKGTAERAPTEAAVFFTRESENWIYLKEEPQVIFLLDGKRVPLSFSRDGNVNIGEGTVTETMSVPMSFQALSALASASEVEFQLGPTECALDSRVRDGLRDLVLRTKPLPKPKK